MMLLDFFPSFIVVAHNFRLAYRLLFAKKNPVIFDYYFLNTIRLRIRSGTEGYGLVEVDILT